MADDPIVQMASDPEFGQQPLPVQRQALIAHDPLFSKAPDDVISQFVAAHQTTNQQAQQDIAKIGAQMTPAVPPAPNERQQTPEMRAQRRAGIGKAILTGAGALPTAGAMVGGVLGSEAPGPGNVAGAGLGYMGGMSAERGIRAMMGQLPPQTAGQTTRDYAVGGLTGASMEMGGQIIGKVADAASPLIRGAIGRMTGVPAATDAAKAEYDALVADQQEAIRQRGIGVRQNVATNQQAQLDTAEANATKKIQYQQQVGDALSKVPAAPPGEQALWVDVNKALQVPANVPRIKLGATDLGDAVTMPGRGVTQEGVKAADLARMTPTEQNAIIAPKWTAAGQRIDALADQATQAGKRVDVRVVDEAVNRIVDENERRGMNRILTRIGKGMGIRAGGWYDITPSQALQLKRTLWDYGQTGEEVSQYVSKALRDQVPELKLADQHYSDLNGAMTSIRAQQDREMVGKFVPPQMQPTLPEPPKLQDFQHPNYKTLAKVPPTPTPPDYDAIRAEQLKKFGVGAAKVGAGVAGGGLVTKYGPALYDALRKKYSP